MRKGGSPAWSAGHGMVPGTVILSSAGALVGKVELVHDGVAVSLEGLKALGQDLISEVSVGEILRLPASMLADKRELWLPPSEVRAVLFDRPSERLTVGFGTATTAAE